MQLASSCFGQAQKITALQTITAVAAAVNGGYLVQPHVVAKITDGDGNLVKTMETSPKRQVISEETSAQIRSMVESVVGNGNDHAPGRNAYVAGYRVGGKSGTSENWTNPGAEPAAISSPPALWRWHRPTTRDPQCWWCWMTRKRTPTRRCT